ncbi:hypothetical protein THAOC_25163 [Thalassiosira oceanica]|uniref:Uncharacterized protein n=1 Tax=Thalassiosira oceanica TaxID=159749 RepID=K0RPX3_THAOC|nr:hypothetical protein THAOC_25163 [Thalassiosira oceanica]|eukprot:EJK55135.1 hypothetical protein THAOC_25163 [Thalassiosira oceanica]
MVTVVEDDAQLERIKMMRAVKACVPVSQCPSVPVSLRVLVALRSLLGGAMDGGSDGATKNPFADKEERDRARPGHTSPGRKRFPRMPTRVATRAGELALQSLFSSMDADAGDDDSLLTMLDAAGGGSSDCGEETSRTKRPARTFCRSETTTGRRWSTPEWASRHSASSSRSRAAPRNEKGTSKLERRRRHLQLAPQTARTTDNRD